MVCCCPGHTREIDGPPGGGTLVGGSDLRGGLPADVPDVPQVSARDR